MQASAETEHGPPEGAVLVGFVLVAEWMLPSGERVLGTGDGGSDGGPLPVWQRKGYLHTALAPEKFGAL